MVLLPLGHRCLAADNGVISRSYETLKTDFGNFYLDRGNLTKARRSASPGPPCSPTRGSIGISATSTRTTCEAMKPTKATKIFNITGTEVALVLAPAYLGAYGAGKLLHNPTMEEWALKSFRATVVGGPALVLVAAATGGDRPTEGDSKWGAFQNFHGVSGHTYFSAIPFITAAKMSENPYQKAILYGLSTLRGSPGSTTTSTIFPMWPLAWYLAYLSCAVVEKGNDQREGRMHVQLAPVPKGIAVTVQKRY